MAALAQVNAVSVFDQDFVVCALAQTVIFIAVCIDADIVCAEINVAEIAVCAINKI